MNFVPRRWQAEAMRDFVRMVNRKSKRYLANVTPAAGKTFFALACGDYLMNEHGFKKIIVVVHTHNLRIQWADDAKKFGLDVETVTYQQVSDIDIAKQTREKMRVKTLVVFDEPHHMADGCLLYTSPSPRD